MNRLLAVIAVVSLSTITFAADNEWDANNSGYNGAFGVTNGTSPDWSTETDIYTTEPGNTNNLGYLKLLNSVSTTVTLSNSFNGFVETTLGDKVLVTNRYVATAGTSVTGSDAGNATSEDRSLPASAFIADGHKTTGPVPGLGLVTTYYTSLELDGGRYAGGAGSVDDVMQAGAGHDAVQAAELATLLINDVILEGGAGTNLLTNGNDLDASGGNGLYLSNTKDTLFSASQAVGGNAGSVVQQTVGKAAVSSGGSGIDFRALVSPIDKNAQFLRVTNSIALGGSGGNISGTTSSVADGGAAISTLGGALDISYSELNGGTGGVVNVSGASITSSAKGGDGLSVLGNPFNPSDNSILENTTVFGGIGGSVTSSGNSSTGDASGGHGVAVSTAYEGLTVVNGSYAGGKGGTVVSAASATADGGDGINFSGNIVTSFVANVDGGTFTGGDGGVADNTSGGVASADGGDGFQASVATVTIHDGIFSGGLGGVANGVAGNDGYAARFSDVALTVSNGTFGGRGVLLESSASGTNAINIAGGSFSTAEFSGNNVLNISTGSFDNLLFSGSGLNQASITGGQFDQLMFDGSGINNVDATNARLTQLRFDGSTVNTLNVTNNGMAIDRLEQYAGIANLAFNTNHTINNIYIAGGEMNIDGSDLSVAGGNMYQLEAASAQLNISDDFSVRDGGKVNLGLGKVVVGGDTVAESGAEFTTVYDGTKNGVIQGETMTFNEGVKWTINGGDNAIAVGHSFTLAESTSSNLASSILLGDVEYVGSGGNWLEGIGDVLVVDDAYLNAIYGTSDLNDALGVSEDDKSNYGKAVNDLTLVLDKEGDAYALLKGMSETEADYNLKTAYVRTPEMANALIGLQSVFTDQIKDRSRSYLRYKNWGGAGAHSPEGAAGPEFWYEDTKAWINDHLPTWDAKGTARRVDDAAPKPSIKGDPGSVEKPYVASTAGQDAKEYGAFRDWFEGLLPKPSADDVEIPATYQIWGRGYGSRMKQQGTGGHSGYDTTLGGAVVGADKRFNNLLLGLGGGYAHTKVNGDDDNDGEADTAHGVAYAAINGERAYVDLNVNYAFSDVDTDSIRTIGYKANYKARAVSMYIGGGLGFAMFNDTLLFTPEASLLTTYYDRDSYTERSSQGFPQKKWDSYDQWSYLSSVGATLSTIHNFDALNIEMEFQPEIRAHWLHEFNDDMDDPSYRMVGGVNKIGVDLQAREEDLFKFGAGVRFSKFASDSFELGVDVDGVFGDNYEAYIISGKLMQRF